MKYRECHCRLNLSRSDFQACMGVIISTTSRNTISRRCWNRKICCTCKHNHNARGTLLLFRKRDTLRAHISFGALYISTSRLSPWLAVHKTQVPHIPIIRNLFQIVEGNSAGTASTTDWMHTTVFHHYVQYFSPQYSQLNTCTCVCVCDCVLQRR